MRRGDGAVTRTGGAEKGVLSVEDGKPPPPTEPAGNKASAQHCLPAPGPLIWVTEDGKGTACPDPAHSSAPCVQRWTLQGVEGKRGEGEGVEGPDTWRCQHSAGRWDDMSGARRPRAQENPREEHGCSPGTQGACGEGSWASVPGLPTDPSPSQRVECRY